MQLWPLVKVGGPHSYGWKDMPKQNLNSFTISRFLFPWTPHKQTGSSGRNWGTLETLLFGMFQRHYLGFPGGLEVRASASNAGDPGSIPGSGRSLEKEIVTHSSILAWRIPRMEKPGRLQSMGSQGVGHDWVTSLSLSSGRGDDVQTQAMRH